LLSCFLVLPPRPPTPTLFPYTTLFRSQQHALRNLGAQVRKALRVLQELHDFLQLFLGLVQARHVLEPHFGALLGVQLGAAFAERSEEHTSELQSREKLVCRLLREKKKM